MVINQKIQTRQASCFLGGIRSPPQTTPRTTEPPCLFRQRSHPVTAQQYLAPPTEAPPARVAFPEDAAPVSVPPPPSVRWCSVGRGEEGRTYRGVWRSAGRPVRLRRWLRAPAPGCRDRLPPCPADKEEVETQLSYRHVLITDSCRSSYPVREGKC